MALDTTLLSNAGVASGTDLGHVVESRAKIFEMTQAAEDAVLRPRDAGPWSHALRAALAARIALLNGEEELASGYAADAEEFAPLVDPSADGGEQGLAVVVSFMDKVAADTRSVAAADITALQDAGILDADIVRLAELNAFLAYQLRVIAGLRLLNGGVR